LRVLSAQRASSGLYWPTVKEAQVLASIMVLGIAIVAHGQTPRMDNVSATGRYFNATSGKTIDCASKAMT
jgi:hypothetical protein